MEFQDFHKWVHRELGINLTAYKPEQLNRRISTLMSRVGVSSLDEYTELIKNDDNQRLKFLDYITINVTEFFRNPELFEELSELIKVLLKEKGNQLKIWSAACSIGCEPYTLGIILKNINPSNRSRIMGTDIDNPILTRAKLGEYSEAEVKNVKAADLERYFEKKDSIYIIDKSIKSMVTFKKHDLIEEEYEKDFDLILCRNVVIYFNNEIKKVIYKKFSESLKKGGLLFIGATESIYNYKEYGFEKVSTFVYRKV